MHSKLLDLYFLKGLAKETGSLNELVSLFTSVPRAEMVAPTKSLQIDLKNGISEAELKLDKERPSQVDLYYGKHMLGSLVQQYGFEPFRGAHLRPALAREFGYALAKAIAFEKVVEGEMIASEQFFSVKENESTYGYSGV
jgi:hypothetical protein